MPWDLLIRGGDVVTPDGVREGTDIAVEDERIVEVAPALRGAARETIDAAGLHVFPGLIDPHVHFNEPGRTEWEGFETGSSALAAGGGTCFFDMPLNSRPPTLDGESFDLKLAAAKANSRTDFGLWGGLTPNNLDKLEELADRGVVGFKAFMSYSGIEDFARADDETLRRGMEIAGPLGLIVAVHAESEELTSRRTVHIRHAGGTTWQDYLASRPIEAEVEAIRQGLAIAEQAKCRLHVVHVSSSEGVQFTRGGPIAATGVSYAPPPLEEWRITNETCPHYLLLNERDLIERGAVAKCAPPVRPQAEVDKLRADLLAGRINFVTSDHSPAPASMKKDGDAFRVWGGISGVQSTLSSLLTIGVPPPQVAKLTAANVVDRFGIARKSALKTGYDADVSIVDAASEYMLTGDMLLDRHKLSPFVGRTFRGVVKRTIVRGHTVFREGKIVAGDFRGRLVKPERRRKAGAA
jgi:allantoinase